MKPRRIKVEVEPLSESRWRRVDDALFDALERGDVSPPLREVSNSNSSLRSKRRVLAGVVVAVAVAAGVFAFALRRPRVERSQEVATTAAPSPSSVIAMPSHIETGASRSFVSLGFASLDVAPESAVTTTGDEAHGVVVVLERGAVECEVTPRGEGAPFVVQSGDVRVRVVGTRFVVRRDATGASTVKVSHGVVEVSHDGARTMVGGGESWPLPTASSASSVPSAAPTRPTASHANTSSRELYEQAARLEARDPTTALSMYNRVAEAGGPWSAPALFAAGRLAGDTGKNDEARALLRRYLDRYPKGANAEDARILLTRLR